MKFRLSVLVSVIVVTGSSVGCAAEDARAPDEEATPSTSVAPLVGTWRWAGSGQRLGDIALGEDDFVFRNDGTYAVLSKSGDGKSVDCYTGTFTWSTSADPAHGTVVFKSTAVRAAANGYERDVVLEGDGVLHFGEGGTYRRTNAAIDVRCP